MKIDNKALALLPFEVAAEISENLIRKDFLPSEIEAIRRMCEAALAREAKERRLAPLRKGDKVPSATLVAHGGRTTDKIGSCFGISGRKVEKIKAVVEAAEREPARFGPLVEEMDRCKSVDGAYRKLRQAEDADRVMGLAPAEGKFRTIVLDPPWKYDTCIAGRINGGYAWMTMEQLFALPVPAWSEENCHLYLWVTNAFIGQGCELITAWGFNQMTVLTWVKPQWGLGNYFRNQSEHVLFAVRGRLNIRVHDISTVFEAPVGEHSAKPEAFYDIVRRASFPPYGEAFQRTPRPDFVNLYQVAERMEAAE